MHKRNFVQIANYFFSVVLSSMIVQNRNYYTPNFAAASDIHLKYVLAKRAQYLPESMLNEIKQICASNPKELPSLQDVHKKVYQPLFDANSLDEVKKIFPEFKDVIDIITFKSSRSKAIKAIMDRMPLENFTLQYLKQLYQPQKMEDLVKIYGLPNRSILGWLNNKLNIKKLCSSYIQILKLSDEKENMRIAELSRQAIYANPEAQQKRLAKAAETHRTPEYRAKKRQEMIEFYKRNPAAAEKTRFISKETWNRCPEIKKALAEFKNSKSARVQAILTKTDYKHATPTERRIIKGFYKEFWNTHPEMKEQIRQARLDVIKDFFS